MYDTETTDKVETDREVPVQRTSPIEDDIDGHVRQVKVIAVHDMTRCTHMTRS